MFWDIFVRLCQSRGVSPNAVAKACGVKSTGTVSAWKRGTMPRDGVLASIADYFGVSVDFLNGISAEGYLFSSEARLNEAKRLYEAETDEKKREELAIEIDILTESVTDQKFAVVMNNAARASAAAANESVIQAAFFGAYADDLTPEERDGLWRDAQDFAKFRAEQMRKEKKRKNG